MIEAPAPEPEAPALIEAIAALVHENWTLFVALVAVYENDVPLQIAGGLIGEVIAGEGLTVTFKICVLVHPLVVRV